MIPEGQNTYDLLTSYKWKEAAESLAKELRYSHNTIFFCFYTFTDTKNAAKYQKPFNVITILWNILFNMGHIYTRVKDIIFFFYYDMPLVGGDTRKWSTIGEYAGELGTRFIYSKYITDPRFKF